MKNTRKKNHPFLILCVITTAIGTTTVQNQSVLNESHDNLQKKPCIDVTLPTPESIKKGRTKNSQKNPDQSKSTRVVSYKEMSYEELEKTKKKLIASGNTEAAIKYIEQMIKLCTDVYVIAELLLETADIFFQNGQFKKAALAYSEFALLYPGHEKVEYALYRGVISSWSCCLSFDRDQTKTEETIALADTFLASESFTEHRDEIITIRMQCYNRLIESEFNVCQFYLQQGNFKAVTKRLQGIREKWLEKVPSIMLTLLELEIKLAEQKGDTQMAAHKLAEQVEYIAASGITIAQNNKKIAMIDRF